MPTTSESPAALGPVAGWLTSRRADADDGETRRHRQEALAILAAEGALDATTVRPIRGGLVSGDTAVNGYAREAAAELDAPRLRPLCDRLDGDVPDWGSPPAHCPTADESEP